MSTDLIRKALNRAFSLGQKWWQQADSDSYSENRKSDDTLAKYRALFDETVAQMEAAKVPEPSHVLSKAALQAAAKACERSADVWLGFSALDAETVVRAYLRFLASQAPSTDLPDHAVWRIANDYRVPTHVIRAIEVVVREALAVRAALASKAADSGPVAASEATAKELTDTQIVAVMSASGARDREWNALTHDSGPYDVTTPNAFTREFVKRVLLVAAQPAAQGEPVGWFLNDAAERSKPHYAQVDPVFAGSMGTFPLYAAQPAPAVPEGWQVVPKEPTVEMMRAYQTAFVSSERFDGAAVYRQMLAAAPTPPDQAAPGEGASTDTSKELK